MSDLVGRYRRVYSRIWRNVAFQALTPNARWKTALMPTREPGELIEA